MTLFRLLIAVALAGSPLVAPEAIPITMNEPGYVWLDGRFYIFDVPRTAAGAAAGPATLTATEDGGFHFKAFVTARQCGTGASGAGAVPPGAGLVHAESATDVQTRVPLPASGTPAVRRLQLAACDGAVVLLVQSAAGDMRCSMSIPNPYPPGKCPAVERLASGRIFGSGFEPN